MLVYFRCRCAYTQMRLLCSDAHTCVNLHSHIYSLTLAAKIGRGAEGNISILLWFLCVLVDMCSCVSIDRYECSVCVVLCVASIPFVLSWPSVYAQRQCVDDHFSSLADDHATKLFFFLFNLWDVLFIFICFLSSCDLIFC